MKTIKKIILQTKITVVSAKFNDIKKKKKLKKERYNHWLWELCQKINLKHTLSRTKTTFRNNWYRR